MKRLFILLGLLAVAQAATFDRYVPDRYQPINVKMPPYNAKGDGITDESTNVQAAIDFASTSVNGSVTIPHNVKWNASTILFKTNVTIFDLSTDDYNIYVGTNVYTLSTSGSLALKELQAENSIFVNNSQFRILPSSDKSSPPDSPPGVSLGGGLTTFGPGSSVTGDPTTRTFMSAAIAERIPQSGTLIGFQGWELNNWPWYIPNSYQVKVYRDSTGSGTYSLVGSSEYLMQTSTNLDWTFTQPINVREGDYLAVWVTNLVNLVVKTNTGTANIKWNAGNFGGGTWTNSINNYSLNIRGKLASPNVIYAGDSIMAGHNTANPWFPFLDGGPSGRLESSTPYIIYLTNGLSYLNCAIGSRTWYDVATWQLPYMTNRNSRVWVIHCGVNDIAGGTNWSSVLGHMNTVKAALTPGTKLFIDEIYPWQNGSGSDANALIARTWNSNYATWCSTNGAYLIKSHDAMGQIRPSTGKYDDLKADYNYDNIHLSQNGVYAMAKLIGDAITPYTPYTPKDGDVVVDKDLRELEVYSGGSWLPFTLTAQRIHDALGYTPEISGMERGYRTFVPNLTNYIGLNIDASGITNYPPADSWAIYVKGKAPSWFDGNLVLNSATSARVGIGITSPRYSIDAFGESSLSKWDFGVNRMLRLEPWNTYDGTASEIYGVVGFNSTNVYASQRFTYHTNYDNNAVEFWTLETNLYALRGSFSKNGLYVPGNIQSTNSISSPEIVATNGMTLNGNRITAWPTGTGTNYYITTNIYYITTNFNSVTFKKLTPADNTYTIPTSESNYTYLCYGNGDGSEGWGVGGSGHVVIVIPAATNNSGLSYSFTTMPAAQNPWTDPANSTNEVWIYTADGKTNMWNPWDRKLFGGTNQPIVLGAGLSTWGMNAKYVSDGTNWHSVMGTRY